MADDHTVQLRRALVALKELRARLDATDRLKREPIAVIGMGCRFPGGANSPGEFWQLLLNGVDAIRPTPAERWDADALYDPDPDAPGRVATRWGGFLDHVDRFDAAFFGISPREADGMDPQQRLVLEVTWEALEAAGHTRERLAGTPTGVFVGVHSHSADYYALQHADPGALDVYSGTGTAHNVLSGRLSYFWDLRGPNMVVDTACSSSLVAVHLAVQSLRSGECTLAIAGGVNVMLTPQFTMAASRMHMLAADGRCKAFDARADGFVRGEGCGVVVLKRLSDALADRDPVWAVLRGSAVNQDGHTNGLSAPSGLAQRSVLEQALANAGVEAATVGYVETHGTGTPLGDPIEVEALAAVLGAPGADGQPCRLGAVKTNIGHLEGAAGIAGLIKTVLVVKHGVVPPNQHFTSLNPHITLEGTRLTVARATETWSVAQRRVAAVSSFGWSGTNAHVVVEQAPPLTSTALPTIETTRSGQPRAQLVALSAASAEALATMCRSFGAFVDVDGANVDLEDLAYTTVVRRTHHQHRVTAVGATITDIGDALAAFLRKESRPGLARGRAGARPRVVFVFPGQGSQWPGMGRQLLEHERVFASAIDACEAAFAPHVDWSLRAQLGAEPAASRLAEVDVAQPVIFAVQVALAALWRSWGVVPDAVVGHSMGEVAAAHVAGALSLEDAARLICRRSQVLRRVSGKGAMALVELAMDDLPAVLEGREHELAVAASNGPRTSVLSGTPAAVDAALDELERRAVFCRRINVDVASHSPQMDALADDLADDLADLQPHASALPFYSTVTAAPHALDDNGGAYWRDNLRQPVLFWPALRRLTADGYALFVEVSPHPVLVSAIEDGLRHLGVSGSALPSLRREEDERRAMLATLGALHCGGLEVAWEAVLGAGSRRVVDLPAYPWQRERFWLATPSDTTASASQLLGTPRAHQELLCHRVELAAIEGRAVWDALIDSRTHRHASDHRLHGRPVMAAGSFIAMALVAATQALEEADVELRDVVFERALVLEDASSTVLQVTMRARHDDWRFEIHARNGNRWVRHVHGRACHPGDAPRPAHPPRTDGPWQSARHFYDPLEAAGIELRGWMRSVTRFVREPRTVVADIEWSEHDRGNTALLVAQRLAACFQLTAALAPTESGALWLPAALSRVWVSSATRATAPGAAARMQASAFPSSPTLEASPLTDLLLVDEAGDVLAAVEGVRLASLGERADHVTLDVESGAYLCRWRKAPNPVHQATHARSWRLIVGDRGGIGAALAEKLSALGDTCVLAEASDEFHRISANRYRIDIEDEAHVRRVLADASPTFGACAGIAYLGALDGVLDRDANARALDAAQRRGLNGLLALTRALSHPMASGHPRVLAVTRGAQNLREIDGPDALCSGLPQAAVWGLGRTLAQEHGDWWGGLVDLDATGGPVAVLEALVLEVRRGGDDFEDQVAYRGGTRYVARLERRPPAARHTRAFQWRRDATYLVTGGFGGVGRQLVRWMAAQGVRRLVVIGRTPIPDRTLWHTVTPGRAAEVVASIGELEAAGVAVHYAALDIADESALAGFLETFRREGWPPIRGVIHAAAAYESALTSHLDPAQMAQVLREKVLGSWLLHRMLTTVDVFVLFSSVAAYLPIAGQGSYAAGNSFLDALAGYRSSLGLPGLAIDWGVWRGLGRTHDTERGRRAVEQMTEQGVEAFSPDDGLGALQELLSAQETGSVVVAAVDWSRVARARRSPFLNALTGPTTAALSSTTSLRERVTAETRENALRLIETQIIGTVAQVLRLAPNRIEVDAPLGSLGMESLTAIEFRNRLEAALGLSLPATLIWNYPTVAAISAFIATKLGVVRPLDESSSLAADPPTTPHSPAAVARRVDDMTDEEVLRTLKEQRTPRSAS